MRRDDFLKHWRARAVELGTPERPAEVSRAALEAHDARAPMRRDVAVVSLGNACEAHGPALAPDIDDRTGSVVATRVAAASGARYLGHAPYATDGIGAVAARWSPAYLPPEDFVRRLGDFVEGLLVAFYDGAGLTRPRLLAFISGHGGNSALEAHLPALAARLGVSRCVYHLAFSAAAARPGLDAQHAASGEHAAAAALGPGAFDPEALARLDADMADEAGRLRTIARYPALGGMAGFYVLGDEAFEPVRARYPEVKSSVRRLMDGRRIEADPEAGRRMLDVSVDALVAWLEGQASSEPKSMS